MPDTFEGMRSLAHLVPAPVVAFHRHEIVNALRRTCSASELYWNAMDVADFMRPFGGAWSPVDHVRHLTKSMAAVARGLRVPRIVLRVLFGRARHASRTYPALVAAYHESLRSGGQAGRFAPSAVRAAGDPEAYRREVLERHRATMQRLCRRALAWKRGDADDVCLPHPLLGRITVREMLIFTLYHNLHHVQVVARRRGEWSGTGTPLREDGDRRSHPG